MQTSIHVRVRRLVKRLGANRAADALGLKREVVLAIGCEAAVMTANLELAQQRISQAEASMRP